MNVEIMGKCGTRKGMFTLNDEGELVQFVFYEKGLGDTWFPVTIWQEGEENKPQVPEKVKEAFRNRNSEMVDEWLRTGMKREGALDEWIVDAMNGENSYTMITRAVFGRVTPELRELVKLRILYNIYRRP